jgi:hypothetical protein
MIENNPITVTGVFTDRGQMEATKAELVAVGFSGDQIEVAGPDGEESDARRNIAPRRIRVEGGAGLGGVVGGSLGCLLGVLMATGVIAGIGPILDGAGVAGMVGGAIGLIVGTILGALIGWSYASAPIGFYAEQFKPGYNFLKVQADGRTSEVADILRRHQATAVAVEPTKSTPSATGARLS